MRNPPCFACLAAIVLLCVPGCRVHAQPAPPPTTAPSAAAVYGQIVRDLADPAMEGRDAGTVGIEKAKQYLVERFQSAGLRPAFSINGERSYTQPFQIDLGARVADQTLTFTAPGHEKQIHAKPEDDFNALGFSADGAFEGAAVFVGYGIVAPEHEYDSYAGLPEGALQGKVAVAYRYEPQDEGRSKWAPGAGHGLGPWSEAASLLNKAQWAAQRGATALLVVDPPAQRAPGLKSTRHSVLERRAPIPVVHVSAELFRALIAQPGGDPDAAASELQRRADTGNGPVDPQQIVLPLEGVGVRGSVRLERPRATIANVAGVLPGSGELADRYVIVGAHYDHLGHGEFGSLDEDPGSAIHPGADDNASGTAALLMLAQRLAQQQATLPRAETGDRRALLFVAFAGEERGLLGSAHLTKHLDQLGLPRNAPGNEAQRIDAMINFDMVGRMRDNRLYVLGTGTGDLWPALVEAANQEAKLDVRSDLVAPAASDHASFYALEVPSIMFFTGLHPDYHRSSDTADKINAEGGVAVVDFAADLIERVRSEPRRMAFAPDPIEEKARARGAAASRGGARLGIIPDYNQVAGEGGVGLMGVGPNTPAKVAGLRRGDVITHWGDQPIKDIYDLTDALAAAKPGDKVTLKVKRGEQTLDLHAQLAGR